MTVEATNLKEVEILEQMERLFEAVKDGRADALQVQRKLDKLIKECNA